MFLLAWTTGTYSSCTTSGRAIDGTGLHEIDQYSSSVRRGRARSSSLGPSTACRGTRRVQLRHAPPPPRSDRSTDARPCARYPRRRPDRRASRLPEILRASCFWTPRGARSITEAPRTIAQRAPSRCLLHGLGRRREVGARAPLSRRTRSSTTARSCPSAAASEQEASLPSSQFDGLVDALSHELLAMSESTWRCSCRPMSARWSRRSRRSRACRSCSARRAVQICREAITRAARTRRLAFGRSCRGSQRERPLLLFVDDLQWADAARWSFFAAVTRCRTLPVLLLVTANRAARSTIPHVGCRAPPSAASTEVIDLGRSPREDAILLLDGRSACRSTTARGMELAAEANGHPLS